MIKPSHYTAPRSRAEATWHHACDPIERPEPRQPRIGRWAVFCAFVILALVLLAAGR